MDGEEEGHKEVIRQRMEGGKCPGEDKSHRVRGARVPDPDSMARDRGLMGSRTPMLF